MYYSYMVYNFKLKLTDKTYFYEHNTCITRLILSSDSI